MEERVELHIMFLGDPVVGTENRMFTIYLGGTRIFGVDPIGFKVVKEFRVTVSRKELLDILDAGELHPPPETQYTYINLLESEELKSLKTDGNARVIARRKAKEDLTQAFKNALPEGKRHLNAPKRFALGHLQAMYEHFFLNAPLLPEDVKKQDAGDMGYWSLSMAYWHGRRGGRFVDCIAHPETCGHAAYQAGYDTGVRGEFSKGFGPIDDNYNWSSRNPILDELKFIPETDKKWHCGECEKPWPSFKEAYGCCA